MVKLTDINADGRHPWWAANEKWLAANRPGLEKIGRDKFLSLSTSFMGNQEVIKGRAGRLVVAAVEMLRGPMAPSEEAARELLCSRFVAWRQEVAIPLSEDVLSGLLASAYNCSPNHSVLTKMRAAVDADMDYGVHDLIDSYGTADAAARSSRGKEIEAERAGNLGVIRAAVAVNFEMARNVLSVLRSLHVAAYGNEGLHPPGDPLSRRVGDIPGAKDGPEDMTKVPGAVN